MRLLIVHLIVILFISKMHLSASLSKQMNFHLCEGNRTLSVQILGDMNDDTSCKCQSGYTNPPNAHEDYVHTPGIGYHKMHTDAKTWNDARKICKEENAHLVVINSLAEEQVLLNLFHKKKDAIRNEVSKYEALIGTHDLFQEGEWLTVIGDSIYSAGYAKWSTDWSGQPDNYNNQDCGALVLSGGMDDVNCDYKYAFFCEMPVSCDG